MIYWHCKCATQPNVLSPRKWYDKFFNEFQSRLASKFHGHDQFGSMFGQVTINGEKTNEKEIMELNLPGVRQRRWVDIGKESMHRTVTFIGVCKDGNVFVLGAKSFKQHLTQWAITFWWLMLAFRLFLYSFQCAIRISTEGQWTNPSHRFNWFPFVWFCRRKFLIAQSWHSDVPCKRWRLFVDNSLPYQIAGDESVRRTAIGVENEYRYSGNQWVFLQEEVA